MLPMTCPHSESGLCIDCRIALADARISAFWASERAREDRDDVFCVFSLVSGILAVVASLAYLCL